MVKWKFWTDWTSIWRNRRRSFLVVNMKLKAGNGANMEQQSGKHVITMRHPGSAQDLEERSKLVKDIRLAHKEWVNAQHHLDYALGRDEVDYAIYKLEAAEKKYGMLLKQAKSEFAKINGQWQETKVMRG